MFSYAHLILFLYTMDLMQVGCQAIPNNNPPHLEVATTSERTANQLAHQFASVFPCGEENHPKCNIDYTHKILAMLKTLGANIEELLTVVFKKQEAVAKDANSISPVDDDLVEPYFTSSTFKDCLTSMFYASMSSMGESLFYPGYLQLNVTSEDKDLANQFAAVFMCGGENQSKCTVDYAIKMANLFKILSANIEEQITAALDNRQAKDVEITTDLYFTKSNFIDWLTSNFITSLSMVEAPLSYPQFSEENTDSDATMTGGLLQTTDTMKNFPMTDHQLVFRTLEDGLNQIDNEVKSGNVD